jgi:hypothetical protein
VRAYDRLIEALEEDDEDGLVAHTFECVRVPVEEAFRKAGVVVSERNERHCWVIVRGLCQQREFLGKVMALMAAVALVVED